MAKAPLRTCHSWCARGDRASLGIVHVRLTLLENWGAVAHVGSKITQTRKNMNQDQQRAAAAAWLEIPRPHRIARGHLAPGSPIAHATRTPWAHCGVSSPSPNLNPIQSERRRRSIRLPPAQLLPATRSFSISSSTHTTVSRNLGEVANHAKAPRTLAQVWAKILQSAALAILGGQETGRRATRGTRPTDPPASEWLQRFEGKLKHRRTKGLSCSQPPLWQGRGGQLNRHTCHLPRPG